MKLKTLELITAPLQWQTRRADRKIIERQFNQYTGLIHIMELHVPYTRYDYCWQVFDLAKHYRGNKILILAGDNLNLDLYSHFLRQMTTPKESSPAYELDCLIEFLHKAEKIYNKIIFTRTNHDNRIYKLLMKHLPERQQAEEVIEQLKTLEEIFIENNLIKIIHVPGIVFQIGDVAICHFENNNSIPAGTARNIAKNAIVRMDPNIKIIYQAHTHYQCKIWAFRKCIIETGAICDIQDYARGDKMMSVEKTITIGYAIGELKDGQADVNKCNFITCEIEGYL